VKKDAYPLTHSPSLFDALGTEAFASELVHAMMEMSAFVMLWLILSNSEVKMSSNCRHCHSSFK